MVRPDFDHFTAVTNAITTKNVRLQNMVLTQASCFIIPFTANPNANISVRLVLVAANGKGLVNLLPHGTIIHKTANSRVVKTWEGRVIIDEIDYDLQLIMNNEHTADVEVAINWHGEPL